MKGPYLRVLPAFLILHSFSVTFFYPRLSPFLIQLQINTQTHQPDMIHFIINNIDPSLSCLSQSTLQVVSTMTLVVYYFCTLCSGDCIVSEFGPH